MAIRDASVPFLGSILLFLGLLAGVTDAQCDAGYTEGTNSMGTVRTVKQFFFKKTFTIILAASSKIALRVQKAKKAKIPQGSTAKLI